MSYLKIEVHFVQADALLTPRVEVTRIEAEVSRIESADVFSPHPIAISQELGDQSTTLKLIPRLGLLREFSIGGYCLTGQALLVAMENLADHAQRYGVKKNDSDSSD